MQKSITNVLSDELIRDAIKLIDRYELRKILEGANRIKKEKLEGIQNVQK